MYSILVGASYLILMYTSIATHGILTSTFYLSLIMPAALLSRLPAHQSNQFAERTYLLNNNNNGSCAVVFLSVCALDTEHEVSGIIQTDFR